MRTKLYLFLVIVFGLMSCTQEPLQSPVITDVSEYSGLEIGRTILYRIDSTIFNYSGGNSNVTTSTSSFLREIVTDTVHLGNQLRYRIEQEQSVSEFGPWNIADIYQAYFDGEKYIRVEDNLPYVKLISPLYETSYWDPFSLFSVDSIKFNIDGNILEPFNTQNIATVDLIADSTLQGNQHKVLDVSYQDFDDKILFKTYSNEKYAEGIGLVFKEYFLAETNSCVIRNGDTGMCLGIPWQEKATSGIYIIQEMIRWE